MIDKVYTDYINDILMSIQEIAVFVKDMTFEQFEADRKTINAVIRSLEILGEASKKISEDIKAKYSDVPWRKMAGMRDKLIHEYSGVDLETVWETIQQDLPVVKGLVEKIKF